VTTENVKTVTVFFVGMLKSFIVKIDFLIQNNQFFSIIEFRSNGLKHASLLPSISAGTNPYILIGRKLHLNMLIFRNSSLVSDLKL